LAGKFGNGERSVSKSVSMENKLPSGVYILMIQRSDVHYTTKVVISK